MRYFQFLAFGLFMITACQAQVKTETAVEELKGNRIEVIDFHTTHRCKTCLKIEDNTKKLLQANFKDQMDNGTIRFFTVDVDKKENYKIAERFEAAGTSLFINVIQNGTETHIDLTDFAFMKAFDEEDFTNELKMKIEEQLKTL